MFEQAPSTRVVRLRRAVPQDATAVAELIRSSKARAMPWLAVPHTIEEDREWVSGVLLPEQTVVVAEIEGRPAGVLAVHDGWLEQLYVASDAQGRGVGRKLVDHAKELCPAGLLLWAFQRNERARRFYESAGFRSVRMTDGADNEEREPDVLYEWRPAPR